MKISRRSFLKTTSSSLAFGLTAGQALLRPIAAAAEAATASSEHSRRGETRSGDMLYRALGRTKEKVSVITLILPFAKNLMLHKDILDYFVENL